MHERILCDQCGRSVPAHAHYVVRIDVFADPSVPQISTDELEEKDFQQIFAELIAEMSGQSADQLQDQVHRRFEFKLCRACQTEFLANPLGKPRRRVAGQN